MNGILIVDKPIGPSSHQIVSRVRRWYHTKKVGHAGTLDPEASGVLVVCIGQATRVSEYMLHGSKTYEAEVTVGVTTDTLDRAGNIVAQRDASSVTEARVREVLASFVGTVEQVPPAFSAIHVNGQRAYDLARKGADVDIPPRQVVIHQLTHLEASYGCAHPRIRIRVECGGGTYIRSLCRDIGHRLGFPAYMSALTRTAVGQFAISQAWSIDEIERRCELEPDVQILRPLQDALLHFPAIVATKHELTLVSHGAALSRAGDSMPDEGTLVRIDDELGTCVALYRVKASEDNAVRLAAEKVFVGKD